MTRVLIADDHPLMLSGIHAVLAGTEFDVVASAQDGAGALDAVAVSRPDILVLDLAMPNRGGMDVVRALRARRDMRPIVLLTAQISDSELAEALDLKVQGILLKEGAETLLVVCLREVASGGQWIERSILQRALSQARRSDGTGSAVAVLTARERAITELVARGLRNRDIGRELGITEGTVKLTLHRVFAKLNVVNRVELAMLVREEIPVRSPL